MSDGQVTRQRVDGRRAAVRAMRVGMAVTVIALALMYLDQATTSVLSEHIRAGYPSYTHSRIDTAATIYVVYLSVLGILGLAGWIVATRAARAAKVWVPAVATALFAAGSTISLADLLVKDTSGDTGLPALYGWVGLLPCVPGLLAVVLLWRRARSGCAGSCASQRADGHSAGI